jgi:hypothetical protein
MLRLEVAIMQSRNETSAHTLEAKAEDLMRKGEIRRWEGGEAVKGQP